jgi:hypothetical protein
MVEGMAMRTARKRARALVASAAAAFVGAALPAGGLTEAAHEAIADPPGNTTATAGGLRLCKSNTDDDSAKCLAGALRDYDTARRKEGLPAMTLPANYASLSAPQQLLVLTNIDRVDRGLPAIAGLSRTLNALAQVGADTSADPLPPADLRAPGVTSYTMGSNWASPKNPLWAEFLWVYDDGYGSGNYDCTSATSRGCWGHRRNVLSADYSATTLMGAAVGTTGTAAIYVDRDPQYTDIVASGSSSAGRHHLVPDKHGRIGGTPKPGRTLTAHLPGVHVDRASGPKPKGVKARITWLRDGRPMKRATHLRYRVKPDDRGHRLAFRAVFHASGYHSTTYTSHAVRVRHGG